MREREAQSATKSSAAPKSAFKILPLIAAPPARQPSSVESAQTPDAAGDKTLPAAQRRTQHQKSFIAWEGQSSRTNA